ncbi:MAG: hypothetical protein GY847_11240 [Proteobacteria bacterium]|nr:hypothetical protein [Pseudomonadota bacterium]
MKKTTLLIAGLSLLLASSAATAGRPFFVGFFWSPDAGGGPYSCNDYESAGGCGSLCTAVRLIDDYDSNCDVRYRQMDSLWTYFYHRGTTAKTGWDVEYNVDGWSSAQTTGTYTGSIGRYYWGYDHNNVDGESWGSDEPIARYKWLTGVYVFGIGWIYTSNYVQVNANN